MLFSQLTVQCAGSQTAGETRAQAVFAVRWYDVGKAVLAGQPGIISVQNGWLNRNEVNRVVYDPELVSVEIMEHLLMKSGTYVKTMPEPDQEKKRPE